LRGEKGRGKWSEEEEEEEAREIQHYYSTSERAERESE